MATLNSLEVNHYTLMPQHHQITASIRIIRAGGSMDTIDVLIADEDFAAFMDDVCDFYRAGHASLDLVIQSRLMMWEYEPYHIRDFHPDYLAA